MFVAEDYFLTIYKISANKTTYKVNKTIVVLLLWREENSRGKSHYLWMRINSVLDHRQSLCYATREEAITYSDSVQLSDDLHKNWWTFVREPTKCERVFGINRVRSRNS